MTYPKPILDAGMAALRSYLPGEHEEDPRIVQAIYEAMSAAMEAQNEPPYELYLSPFLPNGDWGYSFIELNYPLIRE